jgi:hypothetical protein
MRLILPRTCFITSPRIGLMGEVDVEINHDWPRVCNTYKQYCCLWLSLVFCLKFGENSYIYEIKKVTYGVSENCTGLVDHVSDFIVNSCLLAS